MSDGGNIKVQLNLLIDDDYVSRQQVLSPKKMGVQVQDRIYVIVGFHFLVE